MRFVFAMSLMFLAAPSMASQGMGPSSQSCEYYRAVEAELKCGPQAYLQRQAYPMCRYYQDIASYTTPETESWLPEIRLCLQAKLQERAHVLSCETLNDTAVETHVECYLETGFCDLSLTSHTELTFVTLLQLIDPLWRQTAGMIVRACGSRTNELL